MSQQRTIYKLAYGDQKTMNTQLQMEETHWKPILMSALTTPTALGGATFAVMLEKIDTEDGG